MSAQEHFVHSHAIVDTKRIGKGTRIWAFVHVLENVSIGENCNICDFCFIENDVAIGSNVTVKSGVYLWSGITVEDDVFIGPNVVFTNDVRPRSRQDFKLERTLIGKGASIGANSTVLAGVTIGEYAMTGIGSVVTRDVKPYALVYGNPAKQQGWVDRQGNKLEKKNGSWISPIGEVFEVIDDQLVKKQ